MSATAIFQKQFFTESDTNWDKLEDAISSNVQCDTVWTNLPCSNVDNAVDTTEVNQVIVWVVHGTLKSSIFLTNNAFI